MGIFQHPNTSGRDPERNAPGWPVSLAMLLLPLAVLPAQAQPAAPSFMRDIFPVFQKHCIVCHSEPLKAGALLLGTHAQVMAGGKSGPAVVPGKGQDSLLMKALDGRVKPQMPQGGAPLDARTLGMIRAWIDAGAPAPAAGEEAAGTAPAIPDIKPRVPVTSQVGSLAFRPDGRMLAVGRYKQVQLIDLASRRVLAVLDGHADVVRALAFSPDGRMLAAGGGLPGRKGEIRIWDVDQRSQARLIEGHADSIYALAFSAGGKEIASGSYDKLVKIWSVDGGKEERTLKDHTDAVFALAFSHDGKWLASAAADRTVKTWDPGTGKRLFTLSDSQDSVYALSWHPSGRQIAAVGADKTLRTWEIAASASEGKLLRAITGHEDAVLQVCYSPDGKSLVTASADGHIKVWDPETLVERRVIERQSDWVLALTFSPDGKWLAAGRYDGSVSLYDTGDYLERAVLSVRASVRKRAQRSAAAGVFSHF